MTERAQGALMLGLGAVAIRLGLSGGALSYIKATYVPLLIVAGIITALLGVVVLRRAIFGAHAEDASGGAALTPGDGGVHAVDHEHAAEEALAAAGYPVDQADDDDGHGHGHSHDTAPRIAWMLAAPLFAVLLIAPPPLGSYAAGRQSGIVTQPSAAWPELPPAENGAINLTLGDYASRAIYDADLSLSGKTVRLTGFVSEATPDGFLLTRFVLSCCAADGTAINVRVVTDTPAPPPDTWLEVTGRWTPLEDHAIGELTANPPLLQAETLQVIPQPTEPYEA